jgi:hypothetical protein
VSLAFFLLLLLVRCRARVLRAARDGAAPNAGPAWIPGGGVFDGFVQSLFFLFSGLCSEGLSCRSFTHWQAIECGVKADTATGVSILPALLCHPRGLLPGIFIYSFVSYSYFLLCKNALLLSFSSKAT